MKPRRDPPRPSPDIAALAAVRRLAGTASAEAGAAGGTATWGGIIGALSAQADLAAALAAKLDDSQASTYGLSLLAAANAAATKTLLALVKADVGLGSVDNTADAAKNVLSATKLTNGRTIGITGDLVWTSPSFDGSANVTAAATLATVNATTGAFGSATQSLTVTVNAKGLVTNISAQTITPAFSSITGKPTTLAGYGITDALASSALDVDATLAANSDTRIASQKAVKSYVDGIIAAQDAMVFKGVIDCSASPNYPAGDRGHSYRVSVAGKIGGASGVNVEVGDLLLCLTDGTAAGNQATVGAAWGIIQTNLDGAVIGPASATDLAIAGFDGTSGKLIRQLTPAQAKTFLAIVAADIPTLNQNTTGSAATLTTARTLAATGDVVWSGSFNGSADFSVTATIQNGAVTLAKMANLAANSIIGNNTGAGATPIALTQSQVLIFLGGTTGSGALARASSPTIATPALTGTTTADTIVTSAYVQTNGNIISGSGTGLAFGYDATNNIGILAALTWSGVVRRPLEFRSSQFDLKIGSGATTSSAISVSTALAVSFPGISTTASAANAFLDGAAGNNLLRSTSSKRYKRDIEALEAERADAVFALRPVWYRSNAERDNPEWGWYGLIAEEVARIDPRLVHWGYWPEDHYPKKKTSWLTDEATGERHKIVDVTWHLRKGAKLRPDAVQYDRLPVLLLSVAQRERAARAAIEDRLAAIERALGIPTKGSN